VVKVPEVPSKWVVLSFEVCQDDNAWLLGCREWREKRRDVGDYIYIKQVNFHNSIMYRRVTTASSYSCSNTITLRSVRQTRIHSIGIAVIVKPEEQTKLFININGFCSYVLSSWHSTLPPPAGSEPKPTRHNGKWTTERGKDHSRMVEEDNLQAH
jgi:hypothetical protein